MTIEVPEYVDALGTWIAWLCPAVANLQLIKLSEIDAGVDITPYMPETAWEGITGEQNKGEQTRASLKESWEVLGRTKRAVADITYTVLPQEELAVAGNELAELLEDDGTDLVLVVRRGLDHDVARAIADKTSAIRVKVGLTREPLGASDEFSPTVNTTSLSTQGPVVKGALVANA